ncbi:uncharacterized protein LTR77_000533 [Saxophila tyrrhenica]|uniref:Uncharacterized protein n=1 Tax=Saxophila tyrrhenica TaxID=1690608 RepID=A0AAV9PNA8_9PEZI|nr:hypothetical protein LTR77_000533 [Saxophila tyrrhenica]
MPRIPQKAQTDGSTAFEPDKFFEAWSKEEITPPYDNNFRRFIIRSFGLPYDDDYGYQATTEVTLLQAQTYIEFGAQGGLHAWYKDEEGKERPQAPTATDIAAYTDIFRPTTSTSKALNALASNAKKESIRADVAKHLQAFYEPPSVDRGLAVNKNKNHVNPYFDVWAWTNQNIEWAGPEAGTARVRHSHAILPILYHHFGCVCPSYEGLALISQLAKGRTIVDLGSGNGYWTYMLRRQEQGKRKLNVVPVDNGMSEWRTVWIDDTVEMDGTKWLKQQQGAPDTLLLLVYPNTGDDFTGKMIKAYRGSTIIVAGSQNTSGFTGFAKETVAEWMQREMPDWQKVLQIPLPSFAGKDEALFAFEKKA